MKISLQLESTLSVIVFFAWFVSCGMAWGILER